MSKKVVSPIVVPAGFKAVANKFVKAVHGHVDAAAAFEATKQTAVSLALDCFAAAHTDQTKVVWDLFKASGAVPKDSVTQDEAGNKHAVYKALMNAKQLYTVGADGVNEGRKVKAKPGAATPNAADKDKPAKVTKNAETVAAPSGDAPDYRKPAAWGALAKSVGMQTDTLTKKMAIEKIASVWGLSLEWAE